MQFLASVRLWAILSFFLISGISYAQEKEITINTQKDGKYLLFIARNNSQHPQQVTFRISEAKGLRDNKRPVTKIVEANGNLQIKKVLITGDSYSYNYENSWDLPESYIASKTVQLLDESKVNEGIVVFNKDGCGRCSFTTNYLIEEGIDFRIVNIEDGEKNKELYHQVLRANGVSGRFLTPVILVNGKLSHSHEDLKAFLETLN